MKSNNNVLKIIILILTALFYNIMIMHYGLYATFFWTILKQLYGFK